MELVHLHGSDNIFWKREPPELNAFCAHLSSTLFYNKNAKYKQLLLKIKIVEFFESSSSDQMKLFQFYGLISAAAAI